MFPYKLGVYASLALAASAILLPPDVTLESLKDDDALETFAVNPFKRTVTIDCPGCASVSKTEGGPYIWTQNTGNAFALELQVGAQEDTLDIDGVQLFPPVFGRLSAPFYVTQVSPHAQSEEPVRLRVTGYTFHWSAAATVSESGIELLPVTFQIRSIESMPFNLPELTINLLKDANGRLMIASFETAKAEDPSPIGTHKDCKEWPLLCKWKSILADRIDSMKKQMGKGCHKHKAGNPMVEGHHRKPPHAFRPGHEHPHQRPHHHAHGQGHHRHHSHHRFHMFLRRAFFTIMIPILIGIFAGTLTYIIGMALGYIIAVVVMKVRGYGPYEAVPQDEENRDSGDDDLDEGMDKKEAFAPVPEYDAPPVYEVAAEKEVVSDTN